MKISTYLVPRTAWDEDNQRYRPDDSHAKDFSIDASVTNIPKKSTCTWTLKSTNAITVGPCQGTTISNVAQNDQVSVKLSDAPAQLTSANIETCNTKCIFNIVSNNFESLSNQYHLMKNKLNDYLYEKQKNNARLALARHNGKINENERDMLKKKLVQLYVCQQIKAG